MIRKENIIIVYILICKYDAVHGDLIYPTKLHFNLDAWMLSVVRPDWTLFRQKSLSTEDIFIMFSCT